ncbi:unnamed protein product [Closterium sp. Yama58-4]|nr:unnamed protein product [Closterium sp. Yama58-4]
MKRKWDWADSLRQAASIKAAPDDWPSPPFHKPPPAPLLPTQTHIPSTVSLVIKRSRSASDRDCHFPHPRASVPPSASFLYGIPGAPRSSVLNSGPRGHLGAEINASQGAATASAVAPGDEPNRKGVAVAANGTADNQAGETNMGGGVEVKLKEGTKSGTARGGRLGEGTAMAGKSGMDAATLVVQMVLAQLSLNQQRLQATLATKTATAATVMAKVTTATTHSDVGENRKDSAKWCCVTPPPHIPAAVAATASNASGSANAQTPPSNAAGKAGPRSKVAARGGVAGDGESVPVQLLPPPVALPPPAPQVEAVAQSRAAPLAAPGSRGPAVNAARGSGLRMNARFPPNHTASKSSPPPASPNAAFPRNAATSTTVTAAVPSALSTRPVPESSTRQCNATAAPVKNLELRPTAPTNGSPNIRVGNGSSGNAATRGVGGAGPAGKSMVPVPVSLLSRVQEQAQQGVKQKRSEVIGGRDEEESMREEGNEGGSIKRRREGDQGMRLGMGMEVVEEQSGSSSALSSLALVVGEMSGESGKGE